MSLLHVFTTPPLSPHIVEEAGERLQAMSVLSFFFIYLLIFHDTGREAGERLWAMSEELVDGHVLLPPRTFARTRLHSLDQPSVGVLFAGMVSALFVAVLWVVVLQ
jgi:hypothetical protein